jgi:hypothetical protein
VSYNSETNKTDKGEKKEREVEGKNKKRRTKEESRKRWWMIKQQTRQPNP